jgi:hypothetical protein
MELSRSHSKLASVRIGITQPLFIAFALGLLALVTYLWQLSVLGFLQFYDTGVYLAASIHFVSGIMPYRDFVFAQPPGIVLLMSPVAVFSRIFGSHDGLTLARAVSAIVTALNVSLLAWLVRHRGRVAMLIAGVGFALLPSAGFVSSGLRLEPYCICLILLGSLVILSNESRQTQLTNRRLALGGVLFGLAALVKLWAFFPFIALAICLVPHYRRRAFFFVGAAGSTFVLISLPFFLSAPRSFLSEVLVEQLFRKANVAFGAESWILRLNQMTGFLYTQIAPTSRETVISFALLVCLVVVAYAHRRAREIVDVYLLLAALFTTFGLLAAPEYFNYYSYFTAPFLLGLFAVCIGRLAPLARNIVEKIGLSRDMRKFAQTATALAAVLLVVALTLYSTSFYSLAARFGISATAISPITRVIPQNSCVIYTEVALGAFANRLETNKPNCPDVVDGSGMWMAWGYHLVPPPSAFVSEWKSYFQSAQYVVSLNQLTGRDGVYSYRQATVIPWNRALIVWFANHYRLIFARHGLFIYLHKHSS